MWSIMITHNGPSVFSSLPVPEEMCYLENELPATKSSQLPTICRNFPPVTKRKTKLPVFTVTGCWVENVDIHTGRTLHEHRLWFPKCYEDIASLGLAAEVCGVVFRIFFYLLEFRGSCSPVVNRAQSVKTQVYLVSTAGSSLFHLVLLLSALRLWLVEAEFIDSHGFKGQSRAAPPT